MKQDHLTLVIYKTDPEAETAIKADKFVVIAHGTAAEAEKAREAISRTAYESVLADQAPWLEAEAIAEATAR